MSEARWFPARGYAALSPKAALTPFQFQRRQPGPRDVQIQILFCGICHSDVHQVRDEWGGARFPMVPGHEIVGRVVQVGAEVQGFRPGQLAGVGCLVDSCRTCDSCQAGFEQYCEGGWVGTYNSVERDGTTPTYGGYSDQIVVDQAYVLRIPEGLDPAAAAPLLCAGITTYSPLRHFRVGAGQRVGVVGIGGLGHMGIKFARAFGAHVTVFTTSRSKFDDAQRLGAHDVVLSTDAAAMQAQAGRFDFVLSTISAPHDINQLVNLLHRDGTITIVGAPDKPHEVQGFNLILKRRRLAGSLIGGIAETQEMLDFCAAHGITSDIEITSVQGVNQAYDRVVRGDVKYRFVIDLATLGA